MTFYVTQWITHSGLGRASTLAKRAHQYMTKHRLRRTLLIWPLLHLWFICVRLIFCHIHFVCCITGLYKIPEVYFFGKKSDSVLKVLLMKINHKAEHRYKIRGGVLKFILSLTVGMCVWGKKYWSDYKHVCITNKTSWYSHQNKVNAFLHNKWSDSFDWRWFW